MGQTLSSETLSISGGDGYKYWVGLTMKPSDVGCKKTVYKGVLLGHGPRQWEKVVAKAFTDIPGTRTSWKHELNKADVTKQLAVKFVQEYPSLCAIRIIIPGIVQMDRVSNINKWLADKTDGRGLTEDEWISIEELIPGKMGRYCPWSTKHTEDNVESKHMQAFSHFTYKHTNGELVACDFQGIYDHKKSQYIFTDSSIHSIFKLYGLFDQGEHGISEFFKLHKCNNICSGWPKPTPLTPPPSFEAASMLHNNLTPASAFENIIFPAPGRETVTYEPEAHIRNGNNERRRHQSERHHRLQRQAECTWIGQSLDLHNYQRRMNGRTDESQAGQNAGGQNKHLPPPYENLPASLKSSQPPSYDSLINHGYDSNNHTSDINSKSTFQYRGQQGSLKHLSNVRERCEENVFKLRHRSATDPLLCKKDAADCHTSGACSSSFTLNIQKQGSQSCSEVNKSSPLFYSDEALPHLVVPSAPQDEGDDINGT